MNHYPQLGSRNGFTLIELMIVVMIIGVLSSIAIPQYQNYVKKSQLGAALATIAALKINAEDYIASEGVFPNLDSSAVVSELGATASPLGSIESKANSSSTQSGQVILSLNSTTQFASNKIALARDSDGLWSCITDLELARYVPKQCSKGTIL
jgi:type IV pilus assembly protein PilA